jgi:hypothetical protein
MIKTTDFPKHTLRELNLRWHEIELDLPNLELIQRKMYEMSREKTYKPEQDLARTLGDNYGEMIKRLVEEQSELETYLIEHEAEGWTST